MAVNEFKRKDQTKYYMIDFRDGTGRRVREFGGCTRTEARNLLERRRSEVRLGTYVNPKDAKRQAAEEIGPTFAEFAPRFMVETGKTGSHYYTASLSPTGAIMRHFGEMRIRQICTADLDKFKAERLLEVSPSTVRKNLVCIGTMFKYARRWGVIDDNPADDLEKPSEPTHKVRFLSREEWARLEATARPWLLPILTMAVATGMRLKEVTSLRWSDVDLTAGILHVDENTKTGTRPIPISDTVRGVLDSVGKVRRLRGGHAFLDPDGEPMTSTQARNRLSVDTTAAMRAAGIEDAGFHSIRHTAASWMVQSGVPLYEVQRILGHTSADMTQRYAHLEPRHLRGSVAAIDNVLRTEMDTQADTAKTGSA